MSSSNNSSPLAAFDSTPSNPKVRPSRSPTLPPSLKLSKNKLNLSSINSSDFTNYPIPNSPSIESPYPYPNRFLPKQLVMGSPFYQTSESSFAQHPGQNGSYKQSNYFFRSTDDMTIKEAEEFTDDNEASPNIPEETSTKAIGKERPTRNPTDTESKFSVSSTELSSNSINTRSLKFSNLADTVSLADVLNQIHFGPIETCYFEEDAEEGEEQKNIYRTVVVTFIDSFIASNCFFFIQQHFEGIRSALNSTDLEVRPELHTPAMSPAVKNAMNKDGASRVIFLSNLPSDLNSKILFNELSKFGTVQSIDYNISKNSGFVYFTSILNAMKCFNQLPFSNSIVSSSNVSYSNDCSTDVNNLPSPSYEDLLFKKSNIPNNYISTASTSIPSPRLTSEIFMPNYKAPEYEDDDFSHDSAAYIPAFPQYYSTYSTTNLHYPSHPHSVSSINLTTNSFQNSLPNNLNNRTVYLGNLSTKTTVEDVCNAVRGGNLEKINIFADKKVAFVTFISHLDAADFIVSNSNSNRSKLVINSKFVKVGWGKNSGNLNPTIQYEIANNNACRNLYIGVNEELETEDDYEWTRKETDGNDNEAEKENNEVDQTHHSEELKKVYRCFPDEATLRRDFSIYGDIEQINYFKNKSCVFINFCSIQSCINVVNDFNSELRDDLHKSFNYKYAKFVFSYGKDRCGNLPKKKRTRKTKKKTRTREKVQSETFYGLENNDSVDTDLAIKFENSFSDIGISSPSVSEKTKKKSFHNSPTEENHERHGTSRERRSRGNSIAYRYGKNSRNGSFSNVHNNMTMQMNSGFFENDYNNGSFIYLPRTYSVPAFYPPSPAPMYYYDPNLQGSTQQFPHAQQRYGNRFTGGNRYRRAVTPPNNDDNKEEYFESTPR